MRELGLKAYVVRRIIYTLVLIFLVVTVNFVIFRLVPADPLAMMLSSSKLAPEQIQLLKKRFHIGEPLFVQYVYYITNLVQGEFGYSYRTQNPIAEEIIQVLPNTLLLLGTSFVFSVILGMILGILAATRRGKGTDITIMSLGMTFYALPTFWIGLVLLLLLGYFVPVFPLRGTLSVPPPADLPGIVADVLWHLILPALTLILYSFAQYAVIMRNSLLNVLTEDYIVMARAKGFTENAVILKHALKNAMLPMVTIIATGFGTIFSGAVITETVFSWKGIGQYLWLAIGVSDFPVLQAVFYVVAVATILANFAADIIYGFLDPRIRY